MTFRRGREQEHRPRPARGLPTARSLGVLGAGVVLIALLCACGLTLGREYEYEEQVYLKIDGSAAVVINASIPALIVLRGLPLDGTPRSRFEPLALRKIFESLGCDVVRVGTPWYRHGRRFVQVRLETPDVSTLDRCGALGWSKYGFIPAKGQIDFSQTVGPAAGGDPGRVNWTGSELVAFRVHVPSKVLYHNVRRLRDNSTGETERGNILTWEQRLTDRRAGRPIEIRLTMDPQSILHRTLWLFGGSFLAAVLAMAGLIWWTVRKGRRRQLQART
jgi:hypothetical protein